MNVVGTLRNSVPKPVTHTVHWEEVHCMGNVIVKHIIRKEEEEETIFSIDVRKGGREEIIMRNTVVG